MFLPSKDSRVYITGMKPFPASLTLCSAPVFRSATATRPPPVQRLGHGTSSDTAHRHRGRKRTIAGLTPSRSRQTTPMIQDYLGAVARALTVDLHKFAKSARAGRYQHGLASDRGTYAFLSQPGAPALARARTIIDNPHRQAAFPCRMARSTGQRYWPVLRSSPPAPRQLARAALTDNHPSRPGKHCRGRMYSSRLAVRAQRPQSVGEGHLVN